jgi:hypothetical protein
LGDLLVDERGTDDALLVVRKRGLTREPIARLRTPGSGPSQERKRDLPRRPPKWGNGAPAGGSHFRGGGRPSRTNSGDVLAHVLHR